VLIQVVKETAVSDIRLPDAAVYHKVIKFTVRYYEESKNDPWTTTLR
jgi:hypothetical protein